MIECQDKRITIQNEGLMILYLYTPMCGTCQVARRMLTVVDELFPMQHIHSANLNYYSMEAQEFGVESVPCLLIFKDGQIKEKVYAFQSVGYLHDLFKHYIQ